MGEPEGLIIEGARLATAGARDLWWCIRPPHEPPVLALVRVRRRLELFLRAVYGETIPILPADPDPAPTWLARVLGRRPRHLACAEALAATDGARVWLPRTLDAREGEDAAMDHYQLLAVEQAARATQGFAGGLGPGLARLRGDLYRVATAVAVDRAIARTLPGLVAGLSRARRRALAARPPMPWLRPIETAVEDLVRLVLAAEPTAPPPTLACVATPRDARAWALAEARRLGGADRYRGVAAIPLWGEPRPLASPAGARGNAPPAERPGPPARSAGLRRHPRVRPAADDEDDASPGMWMVRFDDAMESAEDPMGLERPADHDRSTDPAELGDALADLPEARIVRAPGTPREVLESEEALPAARPGEPAAAEPVGGIAYPEWDYRLTAYRHPGAIVRPVVAAPGDAAWVERVLERHAALVRGVRRRFDGLRPRRRLLGRQLDGDDVDLLACVGAFADRRAGVPSDDRPYTASRPGRRDLAIAVLVDVSASTDAWVGGGLRIVDVEKEALVVLLEALDVLGDRHAVLAFSGEGRRAVRVSTVKDFDEASGTSARRRVAALEPDGYTRVGAAIRHASALLGRERARHRLLLLLSDGKPNDVDEYGGRYGIEDTRQAVGEARLQGLVPFCLTVDREAPTYLPTIFGPGRFAVLPSPGLLPTVLVDVVRSLVAT
jgi:nitric oxide reductase NorD protein